MILPDLRRAPGWDTFVAEHWQKKPFLFEKVLPSPLVSEAETCAYFAAAGANGEHDCNVVFFAGNFEREFQELPASQYYIREHESWKEYQQRLQATNGIDSFVADLRFNLQAYFPTALARFRTMLGPVFETFGYPVGGWCTDSFAGKYKQTVFGVHQDAEDQFYTVPVGGKTMELWHSRDWTSAADHKEYRFAPADHPVAGLRFRVTSQDLLYWPMEYYHIGYSEDFSVSVQANLKRMPVDIEDEGSAAELRHTRLISSRHAVCYKNNSFSVFADPDLILADLSESSIVSTHSSLPVVAAEIGTSRVPVAACNGGIVEWLRDERAKHLLNRLVRGVEGVRISDLIEDAVQAHSTGVHGTHLLRLLREMGRIGAFRQSYPND